MTETELYRELGALTKEKDRWEESIPYVSSNSVIVVGWLLMKSCRSWIRRICSSLTTLSTSACFRMSRSRRISSTD